jgi:hypothetical protein
LCSWPHRKGKKRREKGKKRGGGAQMYDLIRTSRMRVTQAKECGVTPRTITFDRTVLLVSAQTFGSFCDWYA